MTRDWKSLLKESKGLLVAIFISLLLHIVLFGQSYIVLPKLDQEHILIEAQLTASKPAPIKPELPEFKNVAKPHKSEPITQLTPPEPVDPSKVDSQMPTDSLQNALSEQTTEPVKAAVNTDSVTETPENSEFTDEDSDVIVNPNAYKYVETEFDVRTDINAQVNSNPVGKAKIVYEAMPNNEIYKLKSLIEAKGLAALIIPDLLQTSEGTLNRFGLRPEIYLYQFGNKKDKTFKANFDWNNKQLTMQSSKGEKQTELADGVQDLLSFMYQFMFVAPMQNTQLAITNGKKLDMYYYSFEGEETIFTKMGDIKTVHLLRTSDDNDKDELWLALDYQYVPVKIRKTEKDKVYELLATSLKTEKPPI